MVADLWTASSEAESNFIDAKDALYLILDEYAEHLLLCSNCHFLRWDGSQELPILGLQTVKEAGLQDWRVCMKICPQFD